MSPPIAGRLTVVATPIGNLGDLSPRALEALKRADLVACEDTRHTKKLLCAFAIAPPCVSLHEHNESQRVPQLLAGLARGQQIALVSDAGTPLVSDPGYELVRAVLEAGYEVAHIPGPCAVIAALALSGLPTDSFHFCGFLPAKSARRCQELERFAALQTTLVFYEAPHRLLAMLGDLLSVLGDVPLAVSRELTKLHEETQRGSVRQVLDRFAARSAIKGECTIVVDARTTEPGAEMDPDAIVALMRLYVERGDRVGDAAQKVAGLLGCSKRDAYEMWLAVL